MLTNNSKIFGDCCIRLKYTEVNIKEIDKMGLDLYMDIQEEVISDIKTINSLN